MQLGLPTRLALAVAGAGLALTGTVLVIRAAWGAVALALGPIWAFAILGGLLATGGAVLIAAARNSKRKPPPPSPQAARHGAFQEGLRAGRVTRSRGL